MCSDLAVDLSIFGFSVNTFFCVAQYVPRHHVLHVRPGAHLRSAQQRFEAVGVGDDEGAARRTSARSLGQLRELQTCLQRPRWVISENRQRVDAVTEPPVEGGRARPLLRVQAGAQVTAPAVRPGPRWVLLGVPSVPKKDKRVPEINERTLPEDTPERRIHGLDRTHMFLLLCMCCIRCMLCSAVMSKAAVSASPPPSSS